MEQPLMNDIYNDALNAANDLESLEEREKNKI